MAGAATPELAAAVSDAGGLGALGSAMLTADELRSAGRRRPRDTDRPFQANFFCHAPPEFDAAQAAAARDHFGPSTTSSAWAIRPSRGPPDRVRRRAGSRRCSRSGRPWSRFHFGLPGADALAAIREAGMRVLATATTVAEAQRLERDGVDAVVAQGAEAGGHRGSFLVKGDDGPVGTLALVPQVVDAVDVPVVAAGGIADGRQTGRRARARRGRRPDRHRLPGLPRDAAPAPYRERAGGRPRRRDHDHAVAVGPARARALRNRATEELDGVLPYPAQMSLTVAAAGAADDRDPTAFQPMFAGQSAALGAPLPAGELVRSLARDAEELLARLAGGDPADGGGARPPRRDRMEPGRPPHRSHRHPADGARPRAEALALRDALAEWRFVRVLSSPLQRALDTCRLAGLGDDVETTEDLLEWDYGEYEGITTAEIRERGRTGTCGATAAPAARRAADVGRRVDRRDRAMRGRRRRRGAVLPRPRAAGARRALAGPRPRGGRPASSSIRRTLSALGYERETPVITRWNSPVLPAAAPPRR